MKTNNPEQSAFTPAIADSIKVNYEMMTNSNISSQKTVVDVAVNHQNDLLKSLHTIFFVGRRSKELGV